MPSLKERAQVSFGFFIVSRWMDGWMRALLSVLSFFLSLSLFALVVESKFYLTHSFSLSFSSFLPPKQTNKQKHHLKITKYSRRVWQEEKVQEEEEARAL
jgi:hypothetical protein